MTRASIALLLMCIGCGGDDGGTGPLPGGSFDIKDTIGATIDVEGDGSLLIMLASTANLCADARAATPIDRQGQHHIAIDLLDENNGARTAPTAPGTYTIYPNTGSRPPKSASFTTGAFDSVCESDDTFDASGQSGSVILTALTPHFTGTYDVILNTGDHVTGSFDATPCTELQAAATNSQHACMP